jgi:O-antigen/teichoic acid export membrane protein
MALNTKVLRGSAVLTLNELVSNGCSVLRNLILARVLSKDDFGVVATLTVTFLFLEFIGKMAFGQQITSSKSGGDPKFVDTAHTVQLALGMFSTVLFLALAEPLSKILGVPQLAGGMQLLAIVPAAMALVNLGAFTYTREVHFERAVCIEAIPQIIITLAAWPVALWMKDFRAFIWLQIGKAALSTFVSYFVAGRPYLFALRKDYCREIFKYSWPMLVSGCIMLCSAQGDRLLMTRGFDLKQLAAYGAAYLLAATPSYALLKIIGGTALPFMSKAAGNPALLRIRYALVSQLFSLTGTLFAITMVVAGEDIMVLAFGSKYAGAGILAAWISCAQALRMIRGAPTGVAWGSGETASQMLGNIIRLSGLLLVVPVVIMHWPVHWVAIAGVIGEVFALVAAVISVRRLHKVESWLCFGPTVAGAFCVLASAIIAQFVHPHHGYAWTGVTLVLALVLTVLIFARVFPEFSGELQKVRAAMAARRSGRRVADSAASKEPDIAPKPGVIVE